jgi:hypothetical protein
MVALAPAHRKVQQVKTALTPKSRPWCLITAADRDTSAAMDALLKRALMSRVFVGLG